jgi:hypothetical protein
LEEQAMDAKHEYLVLALRLVLVIVGGFVLLIGISGMLGDVILDTPVHDNLGYFVLLLAGATLVLTGVFKTGFFIDFFAQLL